jgi:hypothetical protein
VEWKLMAGHAKGERLVFVRYLDHVLYNRSIPAAMEPQVRESIGWLVYECDQYVILAWDRDAEPPTLKGGDPKASGVVVLKTDILELRRLETHTVPLKQTLECRLNCPTAIVQGEYALRPTERKTHGARDSRRKEKL